MNITYYVNDKSLTLVWREVENAEVVIEDHAGRVLARKSICSERTCIDLSENARGIYLMHLSSDKGSGIEKFLLH